MEGWSKFASLLPPRVEEAILGDGEHRRVVDGGDEGVEEVRVDERRVNACDGREQRERCERLSAGPLLLLREEHAGDAGLGE